MWWLDLRKYSFCDGTVSNTSGYNGAAQNSQKYLGYYKCIIGISVIMLSKYLQDETLEGTKQKSDRQKNHFIIIKIGSRAAFPAARRAGLCMHKSQPYKHKVRV